MTHQVIYGRCLSCGGCSAFNPSVENDRVCDCKHANRMHMSMGYMLSNGEFIRDPSATSGEKASITCCTLCL